MGKQVQTQEEWEIEMSLKILSFVRNEIYLDLRFFGIALSALSPKADGSLRTMATDGSSLFFSTEQLLRVFRQNAPYLDRLYLHTVLHCIFSHLWTAPAEVSAGGDGAAIGDRGGFHREDAAAPGRASVGVESGAMRDGREFGREEAAAPTEVSAGGEADWRFRLWSLACDIAVEYTIDGMDVPCTRRILTWTRQRMYGELAARKGGISAPVIYRMLKKVPAEEIEGLEREFYADDHRYWPRRADGAPRQPFAAQMEAENRKKWEQIARKTRLEREIKGDRASEGEKMFAAQLAAARGRRSYRDFLRKFAVPREELRLDPDEFDLGCYTYGLRLYGNLPLIEPLESREANKIREFVIAVDTSDSTSGELVGQFLRETVGILKQSDSFFSDSRIRILQCDDAVRTDAVIHGERELDGFLEGFSLVGGGGTDFRPVFSYVDALIKKGECRNLCGLLYFTDGKGIYPKASPAYKTAFLFLGDFDEDAVPPWAMRLRVEPEELAGQKDVSAEKCGFSGMMVE